jgi:hypothetical protein
MDVLPFVFRLMSVLVLLLASVEGSSAQISPAGSPAAIPIGAAPLVVTKFCSERARRGDFPVLCPTRYPRAAGSQVTASGSSLRGPSFYWASFNDVTGFPNDDDGHLIFGGQRMPFSLAGSPGQTWPRPGQPRPVEQLALPRLLTTPLQSGDRYVSQRPARILRRTTVRTSEALILGAPPYPDGGFMGGHLIVLWNWQHHGYMLSFHFAGAPGGGAYTLVQRLAAAMQVARSFASVGAGHTARQSRTSVSTVTLSAFQLKPSGLLFGMHPTESRIVITAIAAAPLKVCQQGTTFSRNWTGGCRKLNARPLMLPTSGGAVHIGFRVLPWNGNTTRVSTLRVRWHCVDHYFALSRGSTTLAHTTHAIFDC